MATEIDSERARSVLQGGGELGALMRSLDGSQSPLGEPEQWPQSLRSALQICVDAGFPIAIYWGPELALLYNDAWSLIPGRKHPWALGRPAKEVWPEIWGEIGPLFGHVLATGQATYSEDSLLPMHRHGYTEECYFDFSFSPIRGDRGDVEGVFNVAVETTWRVLAERRTRLLRELVERLAGTRSAADACALAAGVLGAAPRDVPFCALYLVDGASGVARLAACAGVPRGGPAAPEVASLAEGQSAPWPLAAASRTGRMQIVTGLSTRHDLELPGGDWPEPAHSALVAPIPSGSAAEAQGFLVAGVSPRRAVDEDYVQFVERAASHVSRTLSAAVAYEIERDRADTLAEIDRAKTAFFSNVSHEFRTPLTLILGPLEDALASPAARLEGEALHTTYRSALRLLKLVNALLDFSRIEAGRVRASFEPTDLAQLTAELASVFRSAAERAGLALVVACEPLPAPVHVDREMWEKVVLNLLSNALKFTFDGEIEVRVRPGADRAIVSVRDTGTGIPRDELPRIFERFHRIAGARARTHEGSGIGLALVHELVRLHRGEISAESEPGRGTVFTIALPYGAPPRPAERPSERPSAPAAGTSAFVVEALRWLPEADQPAPPAREEAPPGETPALAAADTRGARILLADDNADMRAYIARLLRAAQWEVVAFAEGDAALAAARERPFDLVLTDVMMPHTGGIELLKALRADERTRDVPVVLLSARAGEESRLEGLTVGADDYLVKPFAAKDLVARVNAHIGLSRARRRLARANEDARLQAVEANRAKDEFLAMLGHELRNPLASMSLALPLLATKLRKGEDPSRQLQIIARQTDNLSRIVDDLLDVARVTRGMIQLQRERVALGPILDRALDAVQPQMDARRHDVIVTLPRVPLHVVGDAVRLEQVIVNLLTNAAKYTDPGGRIGVALERTAAGLAELRVKDSGIGIPPDLLARVFNLFEQASRDLDRSQGGLGIGLTVVRGLVQLHGGVIEARSEGLGKGAEFIVRLPLAAEDAPASGEDETPPPASPAPVSRSLRVLVVDDNEDAAEMTALAMESLGHEVTTAHEARTALAIAESLLPDLILLDIGLPGIDGYEAARRLRQGPAASAFVVAVTGYGQYSDKQKAREAGFDRHLTKPVTIDMLESLTTHVRSAARKDGPW